MITLSPTFRYTEIEEFGPITVHYEEGVIGYIPHLDWGHLGMEGDRDAALRYAARTDLVRWAAAQGRAFDADLTAAIRDGDRMPILSREAADTLAVTAAMWVDARHMAVRDEYDAYEAAITRGDVEY